MDPVVLALVAEWWWIAPAGAGAGALGVIGARRGRPAGRRLELDAAMHDVRRATDAVTRSRADLKVARAELLRTEAEQSAGRVGLGAVLESKRRVQAAERAVKVAVADLKARRASVQAARATLPASRAPLEAMPLARLRDEHDRLTARWIAYETDAAKAIDYPAMSDASSPALQEFLREQRLALELRPASLDTRMAPADFAAYRDAVRRATHAFDAAEHDARRGAGERPPSASTTTDWSALAQELLETAQGAIARSAEAWQRDRRRRPGI
ncbi:hypothetical protein L332_10615 [Agrococcus pavilionensis RW1]|uniref:Uncharacterized protein n=1 Tax=Agrococcus pavilionensis RW1 TaxID=1330458 RepID=U1LCJ9_9MICO|nr:hypothetical protein [Agrococcus pavilionensis]ERG64893.1 hypothetical protein L332_10615 [Agrococcus pavilionensis RW1]